MISQTVPRHVLLIYQVHDRVAKSLQVVATGLGVLIHGADRGKLGSTLEAISAVRLVNAIFHVLHGDAEVDDLDVIVVHSEVIELHVLVDEGCGVKVLQSMEHLLSYFYQFFFV